MPVVLIRIAGLTLPLNDRRQLQTEMTKLMETVLNKRADLTAILLESSDTVFWSIGAQPVAMAAQVDAYVTRGTNDEQQKARFVASAYDLLRRFCGDGLSETTYVLIHEIEATDWGFGGLTQEARRPAAAR